MTRKKIYDVAENVKYRLQYDENYGFLITGSTFKIIMFSEICQNSDNNILFNVSALEFRIVLVRKSINQNNMKGRMETHYCERQKCNNNYDEMFTLQRWSTIQTWGSYMSS